MKNKTTFISVTVGVLVFAMSAIAMADGKTFPGSLCKEVGDTSPEIYYSDGSAKNDHDTADSTFVCPIIRDQEPGDHSVDLQVLAWNLHDDKDVKCRLRRYKANGSETDSNSISSWRQIDGWGRTILDFGLQTMEEDDGFMVVECVIPDEDTNSSGSAGRSGILEIIVDEKAY